MRGTATHEANIEMYAQITLLSPFPESYAHSLPPIISMSKAPSNELSPDCERSEMRLTADVEAIMRQVERLLPPKKSLIDRVGDNQIINTFARNIQAAFGRR